MTSRQDVNSYFEHGAIKHCPRCGCRGVIINQRPSYATPMYECGCSNVLGPCFVSPEFETKREAVQWWNVRPKRKRTRILPE